MSKNLQDLMTGVAAPTDQPTPDDTDQGGPTKASQDEARYRTAQEGPFQCSNCTHFQDPNACELVDGQIEPAGYCELFSKGGEPAASDQAATPATASTPAPYLLGGAGPGKRKMGGFTR